MIDGARVKVRRGCGHLTEIIDAIDSTPLHFTAAGVAIHGTRRGVLRRTRLVDSVEPLILSQFSVEPLNLE